MKKESSIQWLELEGDGRGGLAPEMSAGDETVKKPPKVNGKKDWDKIEAEVKKVGCSTLRACSVLASRDLATCHGSNLSWFLTLTHLTGAVGRGKRAARRRCCLAEAVQGYLWQRCVQA